jgi:hypothetical protein
LGLSRVDDRAFFVFRVDDISATGAQFCFSDYALNTLAPLPTLESDIGQLGTHVHWGMFDDYPLAGGVTEIGYDGACKYFFSKFPPAKYKLRKSERMAEFLVKDAVSLQQVTCILVPSDGMKAIIQAQVNASVWDIPIYTKPGCFVR